MMGRRASIHAVGALFLWLLKAGAAPAEPPCRQLAFALAAEGDWDACRTECMRALPRQPDDAPLLILKTLTDIRDGRDATEQLTHLARATTNATDLLAMAWYEQGLAQARSGRFEPAFDCLVRAFREAQSRELFLRAGCALGYVMDAAPHLPGQHPALLPQLAACYREWTPEIRNETRLTPKHGESWSGAPARWAVAFYQRQIAPAIGSRCSLHPSCSRYATEALRKHGLLGMALVADRGVREPDVVSRRQDPITVNGRIRYHDPLAAHDGWMKAR